MAVIAAVLLLAVSFTSLIGVTAAALAAMSGRLCAIAYLHRVGREMKRAPAAGA